MNPITILIAEDNELNIKYLALILKHLQIPHEIAKNGEEAWEKSKTTSFDMILMDIHMPKLNGFEATLKIRQDTQNPNHDIPIIAVSADTLQDQIEKSKEIGMNQFIKKPFSPQQIKEVIQQYCPKVKIQELKP